MLDAVLSRWPSTTIFEVSPRLAETINRRLVPVRGGGGGGY
jgi:hypothetical protein